MKQVLIKERKWIGGILCEYSDKWTVKYQGWAVEETGCWIKIRRYFLGIFYISQWVPKCGEYLEVSDITKIK